MGFRSFRLVVAVAVGWTLAVSASTGNAARTVSGCGATAVTSTADARGSSLEIVALDLSGSTRSSSLRGLYREAASSVIERARAARAGLILFTFTAASSSTNVVYAGTFDPHEGSSVFNRAATNRARCLAKGALGGALGASGAADRTTGSDIGGAIAAAAEYARPTLAAKRSVHLTLLTDGLQAPAARGGARGLIDLGRELARGRSPEAIVRAHAQELVPREARGIGIELRGIDRQRNTVAASTARARQLVAVWTLACRSAGAASCLATSALP